MMIPDRFEIQGKLKYTGVQTGSIPWKSGSVVILRCKEDGDCKLEVYYNTMLGRPGLIFRIKEQLRKLTCSKSRVILDFAGSNRTTLHFSSPHSEFNELCRILQEIDQSQKAPAAIQKAEVCSSPGQKMTSASPFRSFVNKQNNHSPFHIRAPQTSPQQFTSVKSNPMKKSDSELEFKMFSSDEEESKENQKQNRGVQKFLERGLEKSRGTLEPLETRGFYSSTPASNRTYGYLSTVSSSKRPGLMPDPTPKKGPRLSDNCNYSWNKPKITPQPDKKQTNSLQGFSNLGNTCYMNAILQSLFGLDTFTEDVIHGSLKMKKMIVPNSLYSSLQKLLASRKRNVLEMERRDLLKSVKASISATAKRFSGYLQHDAHELMSQVLDQLKEEVMKMAKSTPSPHRENLEPENTHLGQEFVNPTALNFEFEVLHSITCAECSEVVTKAEQFHDLSLDVPRRRDIMNPRSVQDALDLYFRKEQIEYTCSKCGCTKAEVTHKFTSLPRVLVMHLKRYSYDMNISRHTKMGQDVRIPRFLTLQLHCEEGTTPPHPQILGLNNSPQNEAPESDDLKGTPRRKLNYSASGKMFHFKTYKPGIVESDDENGTKEKITDVPAIEGDHKYSEKPEKPITLDEEEDPELVKALELSLREAEQAQMYRGIREDTDGSTYEKALHLSRLEDEKEKEARASSINEEDDFEKVLKISLMETETNGNSDLAGFSDKALREMSEEEQIRLAIEKSLVESCPYSTTEPYSTMEISEEKADIVRECSKSVLSSMFSHDNDNTRNSDIKKFSILEETGAEPEKSNEFSSKKRLFSRRVETASEKKTMSEKSPYFKHKVCDTDVLFSEKHLTKLERTEKRKLEMDADYRSSEDELNHSYLTGIDDGVCDSARRKSSKKNDKNTVKFDERTSGSDIQNKGETTLSSLEYGTEAVSLEKEREGQVQTSSVEEAMDLSCDETDNWMCLEDKENKLPPKLNENIDGAENGWLSSRPESDDLGPDSPELPKVDNEKGELPYSYRLVSIVNHIGSSSIAGHYISDVYDIRKGSWFSFDDSHVTKTTEFDVRSKRERSGYIFFYLSKDIFDDLKDHYALNQNSKKTENK